MDRKPFIGLGLALISLLTFPIVSLKSLRLAAVAAQELPMPVIGWLSGASEETGGLSIPAFRQGLSSQGFVEGRNVEILYRFADNRNDRLPALAADLVNQQVTAIFASGPVQLIKSAITPIPSVFATGTDPVACGLVASLNQPGGNITGVSYLAQELMPKRLQLLHEALPAVEAIGFLVNPNNPCTDIEIDKLEAAAHILGVRLVVVKVASSSDTETAFTTLVEQRVGALLVANDSPFARASDVVALAAHHGLPVLYSAREAVEAGGLMSYGPNVSESSRIAGTYIGRILKGEKPSDLPVQQSTRIEMVLNLKVAASLGIELPTATLLRADEVIE